MSTIISCLLNKAAQRVITKKTAESVKQIIERLAGIKSGDVKLPTPRKTIDRILLVAGRKPEGIAKQVSAALRSLKKSTDLDALTPAELSEKLDPILKGMGPYDKLSTKEKQIYSRLKNLADDAYARASGITVEQEIAVAERALAEIDDRLAQKAKQISLHAGLVDKALARISLLEEKGVPADIAISTIGMYDEAASWKYGDLGTAVNERIKYHQDMFKTMMVEALDTVQDKRVFAIFRDGDKKLEAEVIREMFVAAKLEPPKKGVDPSVTEAAKIFHDLTMKGGEALRNAGADLRLRNDYVLGFQFMSENISKFKDVDWARIMLKHNDPEPIKEVYPDIRTDEDLINFYRSVYADIVSGGLAELGEFVPKQLRSPVNRRGLPRLLKPRNFESYMSYHTEVNGGINLYQHLLDYANNTGRDLGILESYGPKPEAFSNAVIRHYSNLYPKEAAKLSEVMRRHVQYNTNQWIGGSVDPTISETMATLRNVNILRLGKTVIASLQEPFITKNIVLKMRGLPVLNAAKNQIKLLAMSPKARREEFKELAKLGLYLEGFVDEFAHAVNTYSLDGGHKLSSKLANGTMKYSGLNVMTHGTKSTTILELSVNWAERSWDDLTPYGRKYLSNNGVNKEIYEKIRELGTVERKHGVKIISTEKLYSSGQTELGLLTSKLYNRFSELSSPTKNDNLNAIFKNAERQGKFSQIGVGMLRTFLGYPSSWVYNHVRTAMMIPGYGRKAALIGAYVTGLSISSIVIQMIYDALSGKVPSLNETTVIRGLARANFIPFITDFLIQKAGLDGPDKSFQENLLGANYGMVEDLFDVAATAISGEPRKALGKLQKMAEGVLPGKTLWFLDLIVSRMILEQLRMAYDPSMAKSIQRRRSQARKEGMEHWWAPGEFLPK